MATLTHSAITNDLIAQCNLVVSILGFRRIQVPDIQQNKFSDTCAQGRVIVSFVVERDGRITEPKVVKSVYQSLDEEALRVVSSMPKWAPGKLNGEVVRTKYMIPITFRVE